MLRIPLLSRAAVSSIVFASFFSFASAANLSLSPSSGSYAVGQKITVGVYVSNNTQSINAVSGKLSFSADFLQVSSISKDGSIIKLWADEPSYSNTAGTVNFEGVILGGFTDTRGRVLSVTFIVKRAGSADVSFSSGAVLANDGNGTNIVENISGASFSLGSAKVAEETTDTAPTASPTEAPQIQSSTHPDQNAWYTSRDVALSWTVPRGVTSLRTLLDNKPTSAPTKVYTPAPATSLFTLDGDGQYYFHLRFKNGDTWGPIANYAINVDTKKPEHLSIKMVSDARGTNPRPSFIIDAEDALSGISYLVLKLDNGDTFKILPKGNETTYSFDSVLPGDHTLIVRAVDQAGNAVTDSIDFTVLALDLPKITSYPQTVSLGEQIIVGGTTFSGAAVELLFKDTSKNEYTEVGTANEDGTFSITATHDLPRGVCTLQARVTDKNGAHSNYTSPVRIGVQTSFIMLLSAMLMNWFSVVLLTILACAIIVALVWYCLARFNAFRRRIHRNMKDAESVLQRDIDELILDIEEHHDSLLRASKKRTLTKEESLLLERFKRRLQTTERDIAKKIQAIER